ncbi:MAG: helix-turn-helix domain-containing protein [Vicinamibacteria bacterium]|nr:helix-turn-helix domain-containing protein [Vicinamibacteria bacterium]
MSSTKGSTKASAIILAKTAVLHHGSPLSPTARLLLLVVCDFMYSKLEARPSVATLASLVGVNERTLRAQGGAIDELDEAGLLSVTYGRGREVTHHYQLLPSRTDCPGGSRCKCERKKTGKPRRFSRPENRKESPDNEDVKTGKMRHGKPEESVEENRKDPPKNRSHEKRAGEACSTDGAAAVPSLTTNGNGSATNTRKAGATHDAVETTAERFVAIYNDVHGTHATVTPRILAAVRNALSASRPYPREAILAAAVMTTFDDWYTGRDPAKAIQFAALGKSHLDDLLAMLVPGFTFGPRLVEIIKRHGLLPYIKPRVRPNVLPFAPKSETQIPRRTAS